MFTWNLSPVHMEPFSRSHGTFLPFTWNLSPVKVPVKVPVKIPVHDIVYDVVYDIAYDMLWYPHPDSTCAGYFVPGCPVSVPTGASGRV